MRLTVVGAGPAYSDDPSAVGACYLIESDGAAIVLDLGHGAFSRLAARIRPEMLAGIAISHLHPDHFIDLVPLRRWLRYHLASPGRMRVHGPNQLAERLDALHGEPGFSAAALDVDPLEPGHRAVGPIDLEIVRVTHTDDSYAFRVSIQGLMPGLVYSGDVGRADDLRGLIRPGDALLVEVSFGAGPVPPDAEHLDGPAVGSLAAAARAGRVLLTHLLPGHDPVATVRSVQDGYDGAVDLVTPGFTADIAT